MFRRGWRKPKLPPNDMPPVPTAIDLQIAEHQGSTIAIEATQERMQAAKLMPTPNLTQIIEYKTWENGQLRQELAYSQRKHGASMYLLEEVKLVVESLQQALVNFQRLHTEFDHESVMEPEEKFIHSYL